MRARPPAHDLQHRGRRRRRPARTGGWMPGGVALPQEAALAPPSASQRESAPPGRLDLLSLDELTRSARKSSQVRRPTARSGARLAPARNVRAAFPGSRIGTIGRCLRRARRYPRSSSATSYTRGRAMSGTRPGRRAQRKFYESGRHLAGLDRFARRGTLRQSERLRMLASPGTYSRPV
jgi:hypothetical protein